MANLQRSREIGWSVRIFSSQAPWNNSTQSSPNLSELMRRCIDSSLGKEGRSVHCQLITNGYGSNVILDTKLVIFYVKICNLVTARKVFDKMTERSVVTWTAMLSGYSQCGHYERALGVYSDMHRSGIRGTQFTYGSVLRSCTRKGCLRLGMQIQGCVQKTRFYSDLFVQSGLVDLHSKCGKMEDARYLFEMMSVIDVVCWNTMIGGYAVQGFGHEAFRMLRSMLREGNGIHLLAHNLLYFTLPQIFLTGQTVCFNIGLFPDAFTFGGILRVSCGDDDLVKVSQIHGFITKQGFTSDSVVTSSLIDAYAKCGNVRTAHRLFNGLLTKDLVSCTALITGYANEGSDCIDALYVFRQMQKMDMRIDGILLCSMLKVCANVASLSIAKQMHALALKHQLKFDSAIHNILVDMYSKCGEIGDAKRAFDEVREKNVKTWTCLIAGYARNGDGHSALELYKMMESEGSKPNDVTFLAVLFACSHNGMTTEGLECFSKMINEHHIIPRAEHYSCVADLLARGGQLDEAYDLMSTMGVKPNASLWRAILGASATYGNTSLGEKAAKHLFDLNPNDPSDYVSLSSVYSEAGLWDSAMKTRDLIGKKRLRKLPGYSICQSSERKPLLLPA